jgi:O-antigen ligase
VKIVAQIAKYIILLTLLITPFLVCGYNEQSPFELIKLVIASMGTLLAGVLFLISLVKEDKITIRWNSGLTFLTPVLLITALSYYFSNNRFDSFWGNINIPSDSLLFTMICYLLCFLVTQLVREESDLKKFNFVLIGASFFLGGYGVIQHFGGDWVDWWGYRQMHLNAYGTIGQAVGFASILGTLLPISVAAYLGTKNKGLRIVLLAVVFVVIMGIMYSGSRMPTVVSLGFSILIPLVYAIKNRTKTELKKAGLLLLVILISQAAYYAEPNRNALAQKFKPQVVSTGFKERIQVWNDAFKIWQKYPYLGTGPEHFALELKLVNTPEFNTNQNWGLYWHKAHNHLIHFLATVGIFGLLAHLVFAGFVGFSALRIIFKKQNEDGDWQKLGYLIGYSFLFFANLTAFNFILTQLYSFLFPVLYAISTWKFKDIQPRVPRFLNILNIALISIMFVLFGHEIYQYWNADRYFSLSRRALEGDKDIGKAIEHINRAVAIKETDCRFYLRKSSLITSVIKYQARINPSMNLEPALMELDAYTMFGVNCDPKNPESWFYRARLFSDLYEVKIEKSIERAEKGYIEGAKFSPANPIFPYNLGLLYWVAGRWVAFINRMNDAIALKPDYFLAYQQLYDFYYREKNQQEVDNLTARISTMKFVSPDSLRDLLNLIQFVREKGDMKTLNGLVPVYNKWSEFHSALNVK